MKTTTAHKILIVDDDPNDTELTKKVLSRSGCHVKVETVSLGEAALELLRKEDDLPSVIFLDLKMPGLSGIETLRMIRADERLRNIAVIILTNSLLEADKKESSCCRRGRFSSQSIRHRPVRDRHQICFRTIAARLKPRLRCN